MRGTTYQDVLRILRILMVEIEGHGVCLIRESFNSWLSISWWGHMPLKTIIMVLLTNSIWQNLFKSGHPHFTQMLLEQIS